MKFELKESLLEVQLLVGEAISTEGRQMAWIQGEVELQTGIRGSIDLAEDAAEDTLFLSTFICRTEVARIGFGLKGMVDVVEYDLKQGEELIARKGVLLVVDSSAKIDKFSKMRSENLDIYRRVVGPGLSLWEFPGGVREFALEQDEEVLVDPAYLAMHDMSIRIDRVRMHGGKKELGGRKDFSMTRWRGPGKVVVQNLREDG